MLTMPKPRQATEVQSIPITRGANAGRRVVIGSATLEIVGGGVDYAVRARLVGDVSDRLIYRGTDPIAAVEIVERINRAQAVAAAHGDDEADQVADAGQEQ